MTDSQKQKKESRENELSIGGKKFQGIVISAKMDKTAVVLWERRTPHPFYRKVITKRKKFYAHNLLGAKEGDFVEIRETRPISKLKRFMISKIIKKKYVTI